MRLKRVRRTVGIALMGSSLLLGALTPLAASAAEGNAEDVPEETTTFEIAELKHGFWEGNPSDYGNNAVTKSYPPEAVCLVQPRFCNFPEGDADPTGGLGAQGNDLNDRIGENSGKAREQVQERDEGTPEDPVPPDTLPVSVAFGQKNYRSAVEFPLPEVPEGEDVDEFTVFLEQGNPTYSNSSPALRQAVLAGLTCARESEEEQGRCQRSEFEKVVTRSCDGETAETPEPCPREDEPLQVEMCPIVDLPETKDLDESEWEGERSQPEDTLPPVDCILGALGTIYSEVEVTQPNGEPATVTLWGFDLTFALQAWNAGEVDYAGVELRPASAENLAYGDPDPSYSKQVTFANALYYASETSKPPPPPAPFDPGPMTTGGGTTTSSGASGGSSGGDMFGTPPTPASGSPISNNSMSSQPQTTSEQPAVAEQPQTAQPETEETETLAANAPLGQPQTPWWLWLLILPFLGGAYLLQQSLAEEVAVASERRGAMTRLLERQAAHRGPDLVSN